MYHQAFWRLKIPKLLHVYVKKSGIISYGIVVLKLRAFSIIFHNRRGCYCRRRFKNKRWPSVPTIDVAANSPAMLPGPVLTKVVGVGAAACVTTADVVAGAGVGAGVGVGIGVGGVGAGGGVTVWVCTTVVLVLQLPP